MIIMSKDLRKTIKVSEGLADEFRNYAMITGMTHEELLRILLSQKVTQTVTTIVEPKSELKVK